MKYEICIANPAGNITAFVKTDVTSKDYIEIANKIMANEEYHIEQVGYIKQPLFNGIGRVEMMGNEFCGNAARSYGLLLVRENNELPSSIDIEISGINNVLRVNVNLEKSSAQVAMPLLKEIKTINYDNKEYNAVVLDGITHLIVEDTTVSDEIINNLIKVAEKSLKFEALGLMFVKEEIMYPVVYVVGTNSIIHEGSCGSGTIAYAYYLTNNKKDGSYSYSIKQPQGIIEALVEKENNEIIAGYIDGVISLGDFFEIEID